MNPDEADREVRIFETVQGLKISRGCPEICLIIPCYNEEEILEHTADVLGSFLEEQIRKGRVAESSHVMFVDDGSVDSTWKIISRRAEHAERIRGVKLTRNYGHQHALLAGYHMADAEVVISLDADLQDDHTVIAAMLEKFREGSEIVYGVRSHRDQDTVFKRGTAELYYKLMNAMGVELVFNHADFRLLSRKALMMLRSYGEVNLFLRGLIPTLGLEYAVVEYARTRRTAGTSKYPFHKMLTLAFTGITSLSPAPMRFISLLGILVSFVSVLLLGWTVYTKLTNPAAVPGWASSVVPVYFIGGVQLFALGMVGEYIARIYLETKRRPRFLIDQTVGLSTDAHEDV
jgi:glycosyltransferase involved in cell wall biosynthesis